MPKLPVFSGPELVKLALERGFTIERQKGSHVILSRGNQLVVIPIHGQAALKKGLPSRLLKDIGVGRESFNRWRNNHAVGSQVFQDTPRPLRPFGTPSQRI